MNNFIVLVGVLYMLYNTVIIIVMQVKRISLSEAKEVVRDWLRDCLFGKKEIIDVTFLNTLFEDIRNLLGDKKFHELQELNNSFPVYEAGSNSYSGYIRIMILLDVDDINEKARVEAILKKRLYDHLLTLGMPSPVILSSWEIWNGLSSIKLQYSSTEEEKSRLMKIQELHAKQIINAHSKLVEDEDDELQNE